MLTQQHFGNESGELDSVGFCLFALGYLHLEDAVSQFCRRLCGVQTRVEPDAKLVGVGVWLAGRIKPQGLSRCAWLGS